MESQEVHCWFCGNGRQPGIPMWGAVPVSKAFICFNCVQRFHKLVEERALGPKQTGRVKSYLEEKGHGIIEGPSGDVWVHFSAIEGEGFRSFERGDAVEFVAQPAQQNRFIFVASSARKLPNNTL